MATKAICRLVWRRFRRSVTGMIGLVLVLSLLVISLFADFFAPMDPKQPHLSFAPPDVVSFEAPDGSFSLLPYVYPIVETGEFDPVTFQPITGPDKTNPTPLGFFVKGYSLPSPVAHPGRPPFLRLDERQALSPARHRQVRSRHPLPRHHRIAHLADHRADRRHHHDHRGNQHRHHVRLSRRTGSTPGSSASSSSSSPSRSCRSTWR